MIDTNTAEHVIRKAIEDGLVTPDEVEQQKPLGPSELQLIGLVHTGLLSPPLVRRLLEEAAASAGPLEISGQAQARTTGGNGHREERFEIGELLGQGGMGQVYRAYDQSLKRLVALKFLKGDDPDRLSRFLREAQAQARVDHEHVCKVYEVGELSGKPYIAMQLIQGQPLFVVDGESSRPSAALLEMTVDQKVRLMQKVAEGIHAAHREGLIHRDIKPSNIMLERTEVGELKPCVLDFGLAREVASTGVTSLGLAAGTPNFMSPEQALGEAGALDRRTDVYGLGATLYAILAGKPPFEGPSSLDVLIKVTEEDAPALQQVPPDLATIVTKCLQKEPALRYESARALAQDLGRYLDGEPILARKTSLSYRLIKKAKKHKRLVAVGSVVAVAFLVLAIVSVRAQLRAQQRARLAGVFGQEVKAIESQMRIAQLLPEHDITPERQAVKKRMAALEAQIQKIGRVAEGPGHYALGRGHLALKEYEKAREHLERAWKEGYQERENAHALGQVLGALYQRELEAAERIPDKKRREARKAQIQREYRDPALWYLQKSRGLEVDSAAYVEALVAFYEKRYPEVFQKAGAAYGRLPWLYEARELEARTHARMGREEGIRGRLKEAAEAFRRAEQSYAAALEIGRSDPGVLAGLCSLAVDIAYTSIYVDADFEPAFVKGMGMCDRATGVDPENADAYEAKSTLLWRMAEREKQRDQDPREKLGKAIEAARQALRFRPDDATAYYSIGVASTERAIYEAKQGGDPRSSLGEAIRAYDQAIALNPTWGSLYNGKGLCYRILANFELRHGRDPWPSWQQTDALFQKAVELSPEFHVFHNNRALVSSTQAAYQLDHGQDPGAMLARVLEHGERARTLNPAAARNHATASHAYRIRAEHALALGRDPRESVGKLVETATATLAVNPKYNEALVHRAAAQWLLARFALDRGQSPVALVREGRTWTAKAIAGEPKQPAPYLMDARLALVEARWRLAQGVPPNAALGEARRALERVLEVEAHRLEAWGLLAEIHRRQAQWRLRQGRAAARDIAAGQAWAEKALALNPTLAHALAERGALYLEQEVSARSGGAALRAKARASLEQALAINRFLAHEYGPLLEQARR